MLSSLLWQQSGDVTLSVTLWKNYWEIIQFSGWFAWKGPLHILLVCLVPSPANLQISPWKNKVWSGKMIKLQKISEVNPCNIFSVTGNISSEGSVRHHCFIILFFLVVKDYCAYFNWWTNVFKQQKDCHYDVRL